MDLSLVKGSYQRNLRTGLQSSYKHCRARACRYRPRGTTGELTRRLTDGVSGPLILGLGYGGKSGGRGRCLKAFTYQVLQGKRSRKVYPSPWVAGTGWSQFALLSMIVNQDVCDVRFPHIFSVKV